MTSPTSSTTLASRSRPSLRAVLTVGAMLCLVLAGVVSAWASSHPDGLEYVAQTLGFKAAEAPHRLDGSPLAGYAVSGVTHAPLATGLAGILGLGVVAGVMYLVLRWIRRRPDPMG